MNQRERLKIAWPNLLKLAEKGRVEIYFRGISDTLDSLYEVRINGFVEKGELTEPQLLDWLAKEPND